MGSGGTNNFDYKIPVTTELTSAALHISASFGLNALKQKMFKMPPAQAADAPDVLLKGQISNALIGSLVYDTVTLGGNNSDGSLTYFDLTTQQKITVPKIQIPIALCTVNPKNIIVKSKVAGRPGTIKQFISVDDYDVQIRGVFTTGVADKFPIQAMQDLQKIMNATCEVKVWSNFLAIFGINYLVFDDNKGAFEQMENTGRDEQRFTLNCISETPFTISIQENSTTETPGFFGNTTNAPLIA